MYVGTDECTGTDSSCTSHHTPRRKKTKPETKPVIEPAPNTVEEKKDDDWGN
jgi:hypothetical protein